MSSLELSADEVAHITAYRESKTRIAESVRKKAEIDDMKRSFLMKDEAEMPILLKEDLDNLTKDELIALVKVTRKRLHRAARSSREHNSYDMHPWLRHLRIWVPEFYRDVADTDYHYNIVDDSY